MGWVKEFSGELSFFLVGGEERRLYFIRNGQDFFRVVEIVPEEYKCLGGVKFFGSG